ncbi:hypothetical protein NDU88_004103 [Pleurodeles waltl]|uniref:Uncharacterized protein n=1 Tax=Pleurodeles waltl TaxID=8319 RepID=A0AAV7M7D6_PLEWA|nr:hypothetical protein NDU88_004103 [Pleurodeles waltl]
MVLCHNVEERLEYFPMQEGQLPCLRTKRGGPARPPSASDGHARARPASGSAKEEFKGLLPDYSFLRQPPPATQRVPRAGAQRKNLKGSCPITASCGNHHQQHSASREAGAL